VFHLRTRHLLFCPCPPVCQSLPGPALLPCIVTSCPFREGDVPKWVVIVLPLLSVLFLSLIILVPILSYRIYALQNQNLQPKSTTKTTTKPKSTTKTTTKPTDPEIQLQTKTEPEQDPDHDDEISSISSSEDSSI